VRAVYIWHTLPSTLMNQQRVAICYAGIISDSVAVNLFHVVVWLSKTDHCLNVSIHDCPGFLSLRGAGFEGIENFGYSFGNFFISGLLL
jgi:hypothetical protein